MVIDMNERKYFDCSKCPIYDACALAHGEVIGGVIAGRYDISTYEECPYYRACKDSKDLLECLRTQIELDESIDEEW